MHIYEIAIRLTIAILAGAIVGFDRERRGHAAGLRTNMLVALGSATFALVGAIAAEETNPDFREAPPVDPMRTVAAIIGGIGFLGAGVIIQSRGRIYGLTSATGVWAVAAIGAACGMGYYVLAGLSTVLAFLTLSLIKFVEPTIGNGDDHDHDEEGDVVVPDDQSSSDEPIREHQRRQSVSRRASKYE